MSERTSMALPAAKDLRARADRATQRALLEGTLRGRFMEGERMRLHARLLPIVAFSAVVTGIAALADVLQGARLAQASTLVELVTATLLAAVALAASRAQQSRAVLLVLAIVAATFVTIGWAVVTRETGGGASPWRLAIPFGLTVFVVGIPLLPWHAPLLSVIGTLAYVAAAPDAPDAGLAVFVLLGAGGLVMTRARQRRTLIAFRRVERLAAAVARIRSVQDQLVVVEKLEALRVLVGGMAHELNNGLAVSLASMDQIARATGDDPPAAAAAATRAQRGLVRIQKTIERLKRFALADEGVLEATDLTAMLDFALESAIGRAHSSVSVDRAYADDVPAVDTHVSALAEALFQVARNAVESMPKGGTIKASVRRDGDRVVVVVADEGKGIPAARLGKVFDPYYVRESTEATNRRGRILSGTPGRSGLGLSAVYGLVTALGGTVEIRSEVDRGTEVLISLPGSTRPRIASSRPPPVR